MLRVEDHTLANNGLLLQIVTWMKSCLIGTHTTSFYIFLMYSDKIWEDHWQTYVFLVLVYTHL